MYRAARSDLRTLAQTTGESVNLVVPEDDHGVYLYRVGDGEHPIPEGGRVALHASAAGKAILAYRDHEAVDAFVEGHGLPAHRANRDRSGNSPKPASIDPRPPRGV
ncbi:IclR family transcriptional regulator C-terminal domain-containing protein [Saliphagus sp. GCM10025308]